ncbi:MAG: AMP-dependent synthetase [Acidimicrobiia bacterium]|nr:AMP-dependent synthetase [Acidimicrobiia bacterium]
MARLVVLDTDDPTFLNGLRRAWDDGDAILPVDPRWPPPIRAAILDTARLAEPCGPGDAVAIATSGTTGAPRVAMLTHAAVAASASATSRRLEVDPARDRWLACLPLAHIGGLSVVTRALLTNTPLTLQPRFDAGAVGQAAADGCTLTALVPTTMSRVDPARFRTILVGGQAVPEQRPPNVIATYGMTETGSGVVYDGVPLDGVELRISPAGEVQVRGAMLLRAYRDGHDPKDAHGWLPTGDMGSLTKGILSVYGRGSDLIITGGENVWPVAVEEALLHHPKVAEVAVVGRPDPEWGARVHAVVVPVEATDPPTLHQLRQHAKEWLPTAAAPRSLQIVAALPRTATGKIIRADD